MQNVETKISIGLNVLLLIIVGYTLLFSKPVDVNKYESEISRLKTLNEVISERNIELTKETQLSELRTKRLDSLFTVEVTKSKFYKDEYRRLEKSRETVRDGVRALPHDSVSVELTKYLSRRNSKR
jgi:hypothetical protein